MQVRVGRVEYVETCECLFIATYRIEYQYGVRIDIIGSDDDDMKTVTDVHVTRHLCYCYFNSNLINSNGANWVCSSEILPSVPVLISDGDRECVHN